MLQQLKEQLLPAADDSDDATRELVVWAVHAMLMGFLECNVVRYAALLPMSIHIKYRDQRRGTLLLLLFWLSGSLSNRGQATLASRIVQHHIHDYGPCNFESFLTLNLSTYRSMQ